jgi:hypothetical protein
MIDAQRDGFGGHVLVLGVEHQNVIASAVGDIEVPLAIDGQAVRFIERIRCGEGSGDAETQGCRGGGTNDTVSELSERHCFSPVELILHFGFSKLLSVTERQRGANRLTLPKFFQERFDAGWLAPLSARRGWRSRR